MPRKAQIEPSLQQRIVARYYINAKSAEYVFCPANAIEYEFYHRDPYVIPELVTTDGVAHKAEFIGTWNNVGDVYEDEFENICKMYYGAPFMSIKSVWIGRLGKLDDYWHLIKLD